VLNLYLFEFNDQNSNFINQQTNIHILHMLTFALDLFQFGTQFINQFFYSTLLKTIQKSRFLYHVLVSIQITNFRIPRHKKFST
jgi:hypothetical protein